MDDKNGGAVLDPREASVRGSLRAAIQKTGKNLSAAERGLGWGLRRLNRVLGDKDWRSPLSVEDILEIIDYCDVDWGVFLRGLAADYEGQAAPVSATDPDYLLGLIDRQVAKILDERGLQSSGEDEVLSAAKSLPKANGG